MEQLDFFAPEEGESKREKAPLASRMRPTALDQYQGQEHLLGPGKPLRRLIESGRLSTSLVFWGPPGCGKTSLAHLVAQQLNMAWETLSAVDSGVKELRAVADRARQRQQPTLLFIDEIHRYSKTQQDALLPHVESGLLQLIGATTEAPYGSLSPALLSRCQAYRLQALGPHQVLRLLQRACGDERGLGKLQPQLEEGVLERLAQLAQGDARTALGLLEQAILSAPIGADGHPRLSPAWVDEQLPEQPVKYTESDHHACTSALIKSIRGSDTQAALYWLGRMVAGGEPVDYLTRRIRISASEDIGLADPQAIIHTQACCASAEAVGYPEARYPLAQAVIYLSLAPKSDSVGAIFRAEERARQTVHLPVPAWLAPGGKYLNPHQEPFHFRSVRHLPKELEKEAFYAPGQLGYEIKLARRLEELWTVTGPEP
ncbi:MAG: replication-associated recombination protein A [Candidatus Eremiobacteraeota bacterium]|nr:replication-associated recombination protein A [Candidatus Eremiobacteraeota bacterium]MCW5865857.1 replication-associated recombination protein A [Candidatus Eremiobacteraeota bacterium]